MNFKYIQNSFFFGTIAIVTTLFLYLIKDFAFTIFWALVLSILFYPIYKILIFKTKQRENISSLITLLLIVSTIILPLVFTTYLFTKETLEVTKNISVKSIENSISAISEKESFDNTLISFGLDPAEVKNSVADFTKNTLKKIGSSSIEFGKSTLNIILNFFIMLYLIFFFLKDGKNMLYRISEILPMGNSIEKEIFVRFSTIVRSIFKGTMIIAVVQGLIGGMLFFTVGIESALLWGVIMLLLSVIPAVGPTIIIIPTALFFLLTGDVLGGVILLIGTVVVSSVDNILRPMVIGGDTQIPDVLVTLSIFGGLAIYGITGLVIGPVIAGIFITMWQIFEDRFKSNLNKNG